MKVLITGATGFISKNLIEYLIKNSELEITITSRSSDKLKDKKWFSKVKFIKADLEDKKKNWYNFFESPDILIHLAWSDLPNYSNNLHITKNLIRDVDFLDNLIENGLKKLVVTGTCFEYGDREGILIEDMSTNPINDYSIAKDSLRRHLEIKCSKYKTNLIWLRLFYIYSYNGKKSSLLSQLKDAIVSKKSKFKMTNGLQKKDFLHIDDAVKLISKISIDKNADGIYNICSGAPKRVIDLIKEFLQKFNYQIELDRGSLVKEANEPMVAYGSIEKIKKYL